MKESELVWKNLKSKSCVIYANRSAFLHFDWLGAPGMRPPHLRRSRG
jgi:hypothetical protein